MRVSLFSQNFNPILLSVRDWNVNDNDKHAVKQIQTEKQIRHPRNYKNKQTGMSQNDVMITRKKINSPSLSMYNLKAKIPESLIVTQSVNFQRLFKLLWPSHDSLIQYYFINIYVKQREQKYSSSYYLFVYWHLHNQKDLPTLLL